MGKLCLSGISVQGSTAHQLQLAQTDLQTHQQQSDLLLSVLRTISNVMPATPAQHASWQADGPQDCTELPFEAQEVLQQVQGFMQQVEDQHQK